VSGVDDLARTIKRAVDEAVERMARNAPKTYDAVYGGTDGDGVMWVTITGEEHQRPAQSSSCYASVGDVVRVTISGSRLTIDSNVTNPSAGTANVAKVDEKATVAKSTADEAMDYASEAALAAASAQSQAIYAADSAEDAMRSAVEAGGWASEAKTQAGEANRQANLATVDARRANDAAEDAIEDAQKASEGAQEAIESAGVAKDSADVAASYAKGALNGLSEIENVVGAINWISEHGTYVSQSGLPFDPSAVYYERTGEGTVESPYAYKVVEDPDPEYIDVYYRLSLDASVQQYVAAHIAVTDDGLHMIGGVDDYSALLSPDGMEVRDPSGRSVAQYGETFRVGTTSTVHLLGTSTRLSFRTAGGDIAYLGMGDDGLWRLFIDQAEVSDMIRFGNYAWVKRRNGNMTVKYIRDDA